MGIVGLDKSVSLDGYITGPNPGPDNPLGDGGDRVFSWMMAHLGPDRLRAHRHGGLLRPHDPAAGLRLEPHVKGGR